MLFMEIITVYPENCTKHIETIYNQNTKLLKVNVSGTDGHHWP